MRQLSSALGVTQSKSFASKLFKEMRAPVIPNPRPIIPRSLLQTKGFLTARAVISNRVHGPNWLRTLKLASIRITLMEMEQRSPWGLLGFPQCPIPFGKFYHPPKKNSSVCQSRQKSIVNPWVLIIGLIASLTLSTNPFF